MQRSPEIFVESCPMRQVVNLYIKHDGMWATEVIFEAVPDGHKTPVAFQIDELDAQALMDRLWKAGFRPTEGAGSAGSLAATEYHLKDMRKLVFDKPEPSISEPIEQSRVGVVQHLHGHGIAPDGTHYL